MLDPDGDRLNAPRIPPGERRQIGWLAWIIARVGGRVIGSGRPLNIFATLGRHRGLFLPWLWFAGRLMPRGRLPRQDTEVLILRVAHNCSCEYEWRHHERIGQRTGLSFEHVSAVRDGAAATVFSERQRLLLRAADELHASRDISDELWAGLRAELSDFELIELCMLVGHYEMLAMTLNSLRVEPER
jgi:alkylhydroperoxidase family enzyme